MLCCVGVGSVGGTLIDGGCCLGGEGGGVIVVPVKEGKGWTWLDGFYMAGKVPPQEKR